MRTKKSTRDLTEKLFLTTKFTIFRRSSVFIGNFGHISHLVSIAYFEHVIPPGYYLCFLIGHNIFHMVIISLSLPLSLYLKVQLINIRSQPFFLQKQSLGRAAKWIPYPENLACFIFLQNPFWYLLFGLIADNTWSP